MSEFGLMLKVARLKRGLTQLELARALGVRENLISLIETGRQAPTPELREKLEALLGLLELKAS
ncbi:MAG: helix-turn-helix transcriptional regulator [Bacteroidota bacterium]